MTNDSSVPEGIVVVQNEITPTMRKHLEKQNEYMQVIDVSAPSPASNQERKLYKRIEDSDGPGYYATREAIKLLPFEDITKSLYILTVEIRHQYDLFAIHLTFTPKTRLTGYTQTLVAGDVNMLMDALKQVDDPNEQSRWDMLMNMVNNPDDMTQTSRPEGADNYFLAVSPLVREVRSIEKLLQGVFDIYIPHMLNNGQNRLQLSNTAGELALINSAQ